MQRGPPRPRPSSLPSIVITSMPARRNIVLVVTLRSYPTTVPGRTARKFVAVVPLLALGGTEVLLGLQDPDLVEVECLRDRLEQVGVRGDRHSAVVVGTNGPRPQVRIEVRVGDERLTIDHRHHGVEVHERMRPRQLDGDDLRCLACAEEGPRQDLDGHRGRALPHADEHRAVAEHVHVPALDRCRKMVDLVAAEPGGKRAAGEHRVVPVDRPDVHRLALTGGHRHRIDRHTRRRPSNSCPAGRGGWAADAAGSRRR